MDTVKATLSVGATSVALEGPQEFVEKQLDRYYRIIEEQGASPEGAGDIAGEEGAGGKVIQPRKRTHTVPKPGASCQGRVRVLVEEGYFKEDRTTSEIVRYLKDQKGFTYAKNQVSASLSNLTKSGAVRRVKEGRSYKYVNP